MASHRSHLFSLNVTILSAAQHETLSFLRVLLKFIAIKLTRSYINAKESCKQTGKACFWSKFNRVNQPNQTIPNQTKLTNHSSTCAWALNYLIRVVFLYIHNMFWGQSVSQTNQLMLTSENQKYGLIWLFPQAFWRTRGPNREFSTLRGCLGVCGKLPLLRIA